MLYDTATMEIIVRSVALSAFVETPRKVAIFTDRRDDRPAPAAPAKAAAGSRQGGLRAALRKGLRRASERLSGLAESGRPNSRCPA